MGQSDIDGSHLVVPIVFVGSGDTGDGNGQIASAHLAAPLRHLPGRFGTHRAKPRQRFLADTKGYEELGEDLVTVVNLDCHLAAVFGQGKVAVRINLNVSTVFQKADSTADAGLGKAHLLAYVNRTYVLRFLRK